MITIPEHRLEIECVNNDKINIPDTINPSRIYKDGEEFYYAYISIEGDKVEQRLTKFKVVSRRFELIETLMGCEQVAFLQVEEIKEDKDNKEDKDDKTEGTASE